jgi:hypothetical protein
MIMLVCINFPAFLLIGNVGRFVADAHPFHKAPEECYIGYITCQEQYSVESPCYPPPHPRSCFVRTDTRTGGSNMRSFVTFYFERIRKMKFQIYPNYSFSLSSGAERYECVQESEIIEPL